MKKINNSDFDRLFEEGIAENFKSEIKNTSDKKFNTSLDHEKKMRNLFRKTEIRNEKSFFYYFKRVVAALFIIVALGGLITISNDNVKAKVEAFIKYRDEVIEVGFEGYDNLDFEDFNTDRLPKDLEIINAETENHISIINLENKNKDIFKLKATPKEYVYVPAIDLTDYDISRKTYKDIDCYVALNEKDDKKFIMWISYDFIFELQGHGDIKPMYEIMRIIEKSDPRFTNMIPEEFKILKENRTLQDRSVSMVLMNEKNEYLNLNITHEGVATSIYLENVNKIIDNRRIEDVEVLILEYLNPEKDNLIMWQNGEYNYSLVSKLSIDEMLDLTEKLILSQNKSVNY